MAGKPLGSAGRSKLPIKSITRGHDPRRTSSPPRLSDLRRTNGASTSPTAARLCSPLTGSAATRRKPSQSPQASRSGGFASRSSVARYANRGITRTGSDMKPRAVGRSRTPEPSTRRPDPQAAAAPAPSPAVESADTPAFEQCADAGALRAIELPGAMSEDGLIAAAMRLPPDVQRRVVSRLCWNLMCPERSTCSVAKAAHAPIGISVEFPSCRLASVAPGSAAALQGVGAFAGRRLTHVDGREIRCPTDLQLAEEDATVVTLHFVGEDDDRRDDDDFYAKSRSGRSSPLHGVKPYILVNFGIDPQSLRVDKGTELGRGSFGIVYRGDYQATDVAVKVCKHGSQMSEDEITEWKKEVRIMTRLRHPNVLMLFGACFETGNLMIVTEICNRGSLRRVLRRQSDRGPDHPNAPTWGMKCDWAMQIAKGMAFLHYKRIFHRDLKPSNVFVAGNTMKIADFGLSKFRGRDERLVGDMRKSFAGQGSLGGAAPSVPSPTAAAASDLKDSFALPIAGNTPKMQAARDPYTGQRREPCGSNEEASIPGTFAFIAPEVWAEDPFREGADMYSFGVTVIEMFSHHVPFDLDLATDCSWRIMTGRSRPTLPEQLGGKPVPAELRQLVGRCCDFVEAERPSFVDTARTFRQLLDREWVHDVAPVLRIDGEMPAIEVTGPPHPKCSAW
eukprot:TRINITY_DN878_c1_g2_i1.p1 TRINITY_DN878_c1_g2~~TRINITY_DN878_c1_g2_i1.p1  ORF type:complete len:676 (+),score=218.17 TRINITY_DN878_c1_g2_i1:67-2094(+)